MSVAQALIDAWGRRKYPTHAEATFSLSVEEGNDGFCETCWAPYSYVAVCANGMEIDELRDVEIHALLNEIIGVQP